MADPNPVLYVGKPATPPFSLNMVKGDKVVYAFTFIDDKGAPLDFTGATASYTLHKSTSTTPTLSGSAVISGATIAVTLTGTETAALTPVAGQANKPVSNYGHLHVRVHYGSDRKTLVIVIMTLTL
jgi:hypothetical protein